MAELVKAQPSLADRAIRRSLFLHRTPANPAGEKVSPFINKTYSLHNNEARRLRTIEGSLVTNEPMNPNCRVVVTIPAHHTEMNLSRTLKEYAKQGVLELGPNEKPKGPGFEVMVLINGVTGTDLRASRAYTDAVTFQQENSHLPLVIASASYPVDVLRIGRIRKDLAALSLRRAANAADIDIDNLIIVTNDADAQKLPHNYIASIVEAFDSNPKLAELTGFIDYPFEDFDQNHLFHVVQRYNDIVERIRRGRHNIRTPIHAGNTAYRASDYIEAGGFRGSTENETLPLHRFFVANPDEYGIVFHERWQEAMRLMTSARRQLVSFDRNVPYVARHRNFARQGDIATAYRINEDKFKLPERAIKYTSNNFQARLQAELNAIYHKLARQFLGREIELQDDMKLAAVVAGMKISFRKPHKEKGGIKQGENSTEFVLEIDDMKKLKALMKAKHNRF